MALRRRLETMPAFTSFVVQTASERDQIIGNASLWHIPIATLKLNAKGWQIIKLKYRPLYHCPKCGWRGRKRLLLMDRVAELDETENGDQDQTDDPSATTQVR